MKEARGFTLHLLQASKGTSPKHKRKGEGFTLIELLVVIAILGLISTIVLVGVSNQRQKARDTKRLSEMRQIIIALEMFHDDYNRYPDSSEGISNSGECIGDGVSCGSSNALEASIASFISGVPHDPIHDCPDASANCGASYYYYFYDPTNPVCQPVIGFHLFESNTMKNKHGRRDTIVGADMDTANSEYVICLD
jgi:prepilin-type N-terminal cleavage/methylation domain-containing protein